MLAHVVLFSFREGVSIAARHEATRRIRAMGASFSRANKGLLLWQVEENLDQRKSWHIVELAIFLDTDTFNAFRNNDAHRAIAEELSEISDWAVGDLNVQDQHLARIMQVASGV